MGSGSTFTLQPGFLISLQEGLYNALAFVNFLDESSAKSAFEDMKVAFEWATLLSDRLLGRADSR